MKHIKLFEDFIGSNSHLNEFNAASVISKFKKFVTLKKSNAGDEFIDTVLITNPKTGRKIKLSSALSYNDQSGVKKLADLVNTELKSKNGKQKALSPEERAEQLIKKEIEAVKADYKEYDQEWDERAETWVKADVKSQVYADLKGKEKDQYLERIMKDHSEDDLIAFSKYADNSGADIIYKSIDVDKYLDDDAGSGQDITSIVLRSKHSTPDQRKKALMLDWVANPSSAGSLLMASHLVNKLNMGDESKKGLKHRLKRGETFEKRAGGKLDSTVEAENIKAVEDIYNKTQEYYKSKGIKTVTVYRGSDDKNPEAYSNPIESWTTSKEVAAKYGQYVHSKEIPVERVLMGHFDKSFPDPFAYDDNTYSKEIVILGK